MFTVEDRSKMSFKNILDNNDHHKVRAQNQILGLFSTFN